MPETINYLDNTPNARKLLDSLRYLGYDNLYAISDITDNAIDADAGHIWIQIEKIGDDFRIIIGDDGLGMTPEVLDQASRLGSETPRNTGTDLGRFGMGLVTASLSLGRRLRIVTQTIDGELASSVTDFDYMVENNKFEKSYFGPSRPEDLELFEEIKQGIEAGGKTKVVSGTVIEITKCDGFNRKYVKSFERVLSKHVGQVFRMFIRAKRSFYVNGEKVEVNDPLWLDHSDTELYTDDTFFIKFTDDNGHDREEPVRCRLVVLPDHGSRTLNKRAGYNVQRSGFYVLRNNREIAEAELLGLASLSRHPDFIRFRGELFVTGKMDQAMGIEFTKRDVKPIQSVRDQLDNLIGGNLSSIRNRTKKETTAQESEGMDHTNAEKLIDSKASLLIKPPPRREPKTSPAGPKSDGKPSTGQPDLSNTPLGAVKFQTRNFGKEAFIYAAEQKGKTIIIDWNMDHPFYKQFVLANKNNQEALNAVDAMIFSMAAAELKVFDEDNQQFISNWKTVFGANLRTLLS